jgi:hypothetical protein
MERVKEGTAGLHGWAGLWVKRWKAKDAHHGR